MTEIDSSSAEPAKEKPALPAVIEAMKQEIRANPQTVGPVVVYGLSDLSRQNLEDLKPVWFHFPAIYKHQVLRQLNVTSELAFELNFRELALLSLNDESSIVRAAAIDLLWIDETVATMRRLLEMARGDASAEVRGRALVGLARFTLLGEYGEIPTEDAQEAQNLALQIHQDLAEPIELRCRALEALANSNHPDVDRLIREVYTKGSHLLQVSAVFAMGRTCDRKWEDILLDELEGSDNELVYEAVQACGQIQLEDSVQAIGELILDDDREIQLMAIWALGEIGGKRAFEILSSLQDSPPDDEILEMIEDALDAASFNLSMPAVDFGFDGV